MSSNSTTYRTISLEIKKPWHRNYLEFLFDASPDDAAIKIKRNSEVGQYLFSRVRTASFPLVTDKEKTYVKLIMPYHVNDTAKYKYMYFSAEDVIRISDFIEALAYIDFRTMVATGGIDLGMDKKTVISIFSNLIYGEDLYETLKKYEYRKRKKLKDWLNKSAKEFGYR